MANFIIFGKLVQQLIGISVLNLAANARSDRFTLPTVIKKIVSVTCIFQVMYGSQTFDDNHHTFKVTNIFKESQSKSANLAEVL